MDARSERDYNYFRFSIACTSKRRNLAMAAVREGLGVGLRKRKQETECYEMRQTSTMRTR